MSYPMTRGEVAVVLDRSANIFHLAGVDWNGHFLRL